MFFTLIKDIKLSNIKSTSLSQFLRIRNIDYIDIIRDGRRLRVIKDSNLVNVIKILDDNLSTSTMLIYIPENNIKNISF